MGRLLVALVLATALGRPAVAHDWNDGGIAWKPYAEGLALAKTERRPVCLVFYTDWCPHCGNYAKVFHDPRVVEKAKRFVMIRQDNTADAELARRYAPDGAYIPRTFFLGSDGTLDPTIAAPREKYRYFYDEHDPAGVLAGMDAALAKLE